MNKAVRRRNVVSQIVLCTVMFVLLFLMIYPLMMAVWNSFKSDYTYELSRWYPTLPLRLANIGTAFNAVYIYVLNTLLVAVVGGGGLLFIAAISSYTFARIKFPGRRFLYAMVIALMMIPGVLTLIPSLLLYKDLNLLNSRMTLIIPLLAGGPIYGTFLLTCFFSGLPKDVFEAAKIDGAGEFRCFLSVGVPLCLPIIGTLAVMTIVNIWNDYLWPMVTIRDYEKMTISAGIVVSFTSQYAANMPVTFAGYLIASLPLIILFLTSNRAYVEGLTGTSIKM